jgi:hypothetical protein
LICRFIYPKSSFGRLNLLFIKIVRFGNIEIKAWKQEWELLMADFVCHGGLAGDHGVMQWIAFELPP